MERVTRFRQAAIVTAVMLLAACSPLGHETDGALPEPQLAAPATSAGPAPDVPASPPTRIYIPDGDPELVISTAVRPMPTACRTVIDPPREPGEFDDVYACTDYPQPGSRSDGPVILAGHSAAGAETWFNRLYKRGDGLVGASVLLQTQAGGSRWLGYRVQAVYTPDKARLPYMREVWGRPGQALRGRLVLVTCLTEADGSSTRNYVAVATFTGVSVEDGPTPR